MVLSDPLPQCVGTITHRIFELLAKQGTDCWLQKDQWQQQQWLQALLHSHGLIESLWPKAIEQISRAVNNTLEDDKGRWLLSLQHSQSYAELALLSNSDGLIKKSIIDRCFVDESKICWIVDYKTSMPLEDEAKAAFVKREVAEYQSQLANYKKLLTLKLDQQYKIKTALYFTHYPYWHQLD